VLLGGAERLVFYLSETPSPSKGILKIPGNTTSVSLFSYRGSGFSAIAQKPVKLS